WTPAKINLGIALLNAQGADQLDRALKLFKEVLDKEPDNPHAHFCRGIILYHRNDLAEAGKHFEAVTKIDPNDAPSWYFRGKCIPNDSEAAEAKECYEKALKLNPYLNAARYALAHHRLLADDEKQKKQLLDSFEALNRQGAQDALAIKY